MIPDREKVIKGLERCKEYSCDSACPYKGAVDCVELMCSDALELLKEQEAKIEQLNRFVNGFSREAVPVVRCKDCEHRYFASNRVPDEQSNVCEKHGMDVTPDWFCADGRR